MWKVRNKILNKSYFAFFMGISFNSALFEVLKPNYILFTIFVAFFIFASVLHSWCD